MVPPADQKATTSSMNGSQGNFISSPPHGFGFLHSNHGLFRYSLLPIDNSGCNSWTPLLISCKDVVDYQVCGLWSDFICFCSSGGRRGQQPSRVLGCGECQQPRREEKGRLLYLPVVGSTAGTTLNISNEMLMK